MANETVQNYALNNDVESPFIRPRELSLEHVGIQEVLSFAVDQITKQHRTPDICVVLEQNYPFRPPGFIDLLIEKFMMTRGDALLSAFPEKRATWVERGGSLVTRSKLMPRNLKDDVLWISLFGLGFVTNPRFLTDLSLGFENLELFDVNYTCAAIEARDNNEFSSIQTLLDTFWANAVDMDSSV